MDIHINNSSHLSDFIQLNEAWIKEYFGLEESDRQLAKNPQKIIDEGGFIFSISINDEVVATCALFNEGNDIYELARMAVHSDHRRQGLGNKLLELALKQLKTMHAKKVHLLSNSKLEPAIALYKKFGFIETYSGKHPVYSRCNIVMERTIS